MVLADHRWWLHYQGNFINSGEIMRYISIELDDEDFEQLSTAKGDRTWQEYIMKDVLNQRRRKELQVLANSWGNIC
jgi:predicted CopG family antitoxin